MQESECHETLYRPGGQLISTTYGAVISSVSSLPTSMPPAYTAGHERVTDWVGDVSSAKRSFDACIEGAPAPTATPRHAPWASETHQTILEKELLKQHLAQFIRMHHKQSSQDSAITVGSTDSERLENSIAIRRRRIRRHLIIVAISVGVLVIAAVAVGLVIHHYDSSRHADEKAHRYRPTIRSS
jgi:hypothetical protein